MVRLFCQNQVSICRGQGERIAGLDSTSGADSLIDVEMATRAAQAVNNNEDSNHSNFDSDFFNFSSSESGSPSASDSECDRPLCIAEDIPFKNKDTKKERRRERNKVSAQAYRQRRRELKSAQNKMLDDLEKRHQELLEQVKGLEEQKVIIEGLIKKKSKMPWPWPHHATTFPYPVTTTCMCGLNLNVDAPMSMETSAMVAS